MMRSCPLALAGAISATLLLASPARAEDCAGSAFWAAQSLEARDGPRETVIADFNGDGRTDLAISEFHLNAVQVSLRQPDGSYVSQTYGTAQGVGFQPDDLAAGDIDGDGDVDLVVVNSFDKTFTVLKNDGTGLFTVTQTLAQGFQFGDLALGDLDGDGDLDLVTVGSGGTKEFSVFLNTGGTFTWSRDYTVAGVPFGLILAQLDGDTRLDVAVTSPDDGSVSILWNTGSGVLSAPLRLSVPASPSGLAAGDVDGDGRIDLLSAHAALGQVGVLANQGNRSFAPVRIVTTGVRTSTLALGDLDQDGDLDLAVTGSETTTVPDGASILLNSGTGDFVTADRFDVGDQPLAITVGDIDGDGDGDVVVTNQGTNDVRIFLNRGARMATAPRTALGANIEGVAFGDVSGDGRKDLVLAQRTQVQVLRHVAGAVFAPPVAYPAGTGVTDVAAGDIDGDGDVDVVVVDENTDDVAVLRNTGGVLSAPVRTPACDAPRAVALSDMDGDGDLDVLVACFFGNSVTILKNNGAGSFPTSSGLGFGTSSSPYAVAVGDLDGDGDRDFVVGLQNSNRVTVGRNDGVFFLPGFSDPGCNVPESVAVGDVNGDGRLDIAASCRLGSRVRFYLNTGGGNFTLGDTPLVINPLTLKLGDMDGDGDLDLVVVRGNTRGVAVFANDGAGHFTVSRDVGVEADAWSMDVADWDGDGDIDLATGGTGSGFGYATAVLNTRIGCPASVSLSVAGGSVAEGNAGSSSLSFGVTLSTPVSWPVTVQYATADGAAVAGSDYEAASGTLTFAPGETQKTVAVTVFGDTAIEGEESFFLDLSAADGAPIETAQGIGIILNDDDGRRLTLDVASVEIGAGAVIVPGMEPCAVDGGVITHCEYDLPAGSTVTLVAQAVPGSGFLGWTGACTGTGACEVALTEATQVGASFLGPRTLAVQLTSVENGRGRIDVSPAPLGPTSFCDNLGQPDVHVCTFQYPPDTPVTITRMAYPDSKFTTWAGACLGSDTCQVFLSAPGPGPVVEASFLGPRTLTVQLTSVEGGRGRVDVSPPPLGPVSFCDNVGQPDVYVCTFQYPPDTPVTLTNLARPDSRFTAWSGACLGGGSCQVFLAAPGPGPVVDASFLGPRTLTLSIASSRGGRGSLHVDPPSTDVQTDCFLPPGATSASCALPYAPETVVTVTAVPEPGSVVLSLAGACPPSGPCTFTMSGAASVAAVFQVPNRAPSAQAGGPYAGVRGQAIVFDGSGSSDPDGDPLTYQWSLGDGATGTGVAPSHAYASLGTFLVSLVVSDGELASAPATASVTISNLTPAVTLTAPADGAVLPESLPVSLEADALDADGVVVRVEFFAGDVKVGEDLSPPFAATWSGMAPGDYVLTARATDNDGATTTSVSRLVHVNPSPAVALTAPANASVFVAPATVALAATASDDGTVAAVEFYQGSTLLGVDDTSPYTFNWTGVPAGRYVLTARAIDNVGGSSVSAPVTIDVVTVVAPAADSYVRDGSANSNFGNATSVQVRVATSGNNRWTYIRFSIASLATVQSAKLRLFGNLTSTTSGAVQARVSSSTNITWGETSITWNNKPAAGTAILASVPLVTSSTTPRWYEFDLTAFVQAEKAAGHTAVTLVVRNDVASPNVTFNSRQASSNRPELRITP